jgi:hypothetical protein
MKNREAMDVPPPRSGAPAHHVAKSPTKRSDSGCGTTIVVLIVLAILASVGLREKHSRNVRSEPKSTNNAPRKTPSEPRAASKSKAKTAKKAKPPKTE